ncbi:MAG: hypothetical protein MJB57_06405 [Gemmatimonadetes bacterium]|nr:hypothetical protein [Gemmatimonadota bacterium]
MTDAARRAQINGEAAIVDVPPSLEGLVARDRWQPTPEPAFELDDYRGALA